MYKQGMEENIFWYFNIFDVLVIYFLLGQEAFTITSHYASAAFPKYHRHQEFKLKLGESMKCNPKPTQKTFFESNTFSNGS